MTMPEEWRTIVGYEGQYEVSNLGRVKSCARTRRTGTSEVVMLEKLMVLHFHSNGYHAVWLRRPGEHRKFFVHRLVADAFLAPAHTTEVVNHKDGNEQNNRIENLEWATFSENTRHYYDTLKPALKNGYIGELIDIVPFQPEDIPF